MKRLKELLGTDQVDLDRLKKHIKDKEEGGKSNGRQTR